MSTFYFGGKWSDELDLIVTRPMVRPTWAPETEFTPIIGRPRKNPYTKTYYENARMIVRAVMADASQEKVRDIYSTLRGYGHFVISTSPYEYMNAYCRLPVPEAQALLMADLPIEFECEPFAYKTVSSGFGITDATSYVEVPNTGTVFVDPVIWYKPNKATTVFDCNGKTFTVATPQEIITASYAATYKITINCDDELVYFTRPNGENVGCTELSTGSFPRLGVGMNYIKHDGVREAHIDYTERFY